MSDIGADDLRQSRDDAAKSSSLQKKEVEHLLVANEQLTAQSFYTGKTKVTCNI